MPTNRELEIIMRLKDEVTKRLQGIEGGFVRFRNRIKELATEMKQLGRDITQIGHSLTLLGAAITGPMLLAFKNSADYSGRVSEQIDRLKNVTLAFQLTIGNALAPIMEKFTNILGALLDRWNALGTSQQQAIVQSLFMTGVYLSMTGIVVALTGKIIVFGAEVLKLVKFFMGLSGAQMGILAIAAAVAVLILFWDKLKNVAIPVLNAIEIGANMVAIGFHKMVSSIVDGAIQMSHSLADFYRTLGKIAGPQQQIFLSMAQGLDSVDGKLRGLSVAEHQTISDLEKNISNVFVNGKGKVVDFFDGVHQRIKSVFDLFKNPPKFDIKPLVKNFDALKEIAQNTAQAMSHSLGDFFFNVVTGKLNSLKQVFADFGQSILHILSNALAKLLLIKTVGMAFPGIGQFFHQGGIVYHAGGLIQRAHSGMLASDEVPIIAQTGEGVLSRRGMSGLGVDNFNRLNRGESIGGGNVSIVINPVIQAWDSRDIYRNRQMITGVISEAIKSNTQLRKIIKDYA